jgi:hypothetical protein
MTKQEAIQHLLIGNDPETMEEVIETIMEKWSDEKVLKVWNYRDTINKKGLRLVKIDDHFEVEFYIPLEILYSELWVDMLKHNKQ